MRKAWLHVAAALVGLMLSAVVVVLVFGGADRDGSSPEGQAPAAQTVAGEEACGQSRVAGATRAQALRIARRELPVILNEERQQVTVSDRKQVNWFAAIHMGLRLCTDEIEVLQRRVIVSAQVPDNATRAQIAQWTFDALGWSFEQPLVRDFSEFHVGGAGRERTLVVSRRLWTQFELNHDTLGLPFTLQGLKKFSRRVGYSQRDLKMTGW